MPGTPQKKSGFDPKAEPPPRRAIPPPGGRSPATHAMSGAFLRRRPAERRGTTPGDADIRLFGNTHAVRLQEADALNLALRSQCQGDSNLRSPKPYATSVSLACAAPNEPTRTNLPGRSPCPTNREQATTDDNAEQYSSHRRKSKAR